MTTKQKQWQLYYLGYYGGEIDGIWGAGSKAATVSFQMESVIHNSMIIRANATILKNMAARIGSTVSSV